MLYHSFAFGCRKHFAMTVRGTSKPYHNHMMLRCTNMWHRVIQSCRKIHHQIRWIVNFIHHAKNKLEVCHVEDCPFCKILLLPAEIEIQSPRLARHQSMECGHGGRDANDHHVWICHNRHNTHYAMDASDYLTATAITPAPVLATIPAVEDRAQFISKPLNDLFSIYINLYISKNRVSHQIPYSICKWIPH